MSMNKIQIMAFSAGILLLASCSDIPESPAEKNALPPVFPDITDVTIPLNIAPLNFRTTVPAEKIILRIESGTDKLIVSGKDKIRITNRIVIILFRF